MQATLTEIKRQPRKMSRAIFAGQVVHITDHGKPFARANPDYPVVTMSAAEFKNLTLEDPELNQAINEALAEVRA